MNARALLLLCVCSAACAELPPVIGAKEVGVTADVSRSPVSSPATYEMMKRLEQMQVEVQQLTGKVEEQSFQIEELKKQQKTMFTDFDDRIQSIENKSGTGQPTSETPVSPSEPPGSGAPEAATLVPPPVTELQASPEQSMEKQPAPSLAAPITPAPAAPPAQSASGQVSATEKQEYQQAYDDLRNGRTAAAITKLNTYITTHPNSAYISNAYYWLGEAHRVNQDNASARTAFNNVIEKFPASEKVPDSLLKLGYIEKDEKNIPKARELLMRVTNEYPNSKAAKLAQKKLPMLEGSAH